MRLHGAVGLVIAVATAIGAGDEPEGEKRPAVSVRLTRPDQELHDLLALFEGARAPSPAAALAAWKLRTGKTLGKPAEAMIALLNPEMVRDLRTLDGAEALVAFDADGRAHGSATIPRDDGTFAALATALALTDGAAEEPIGAAAVDRLGRPGSWLMARRGAAMVLAPDRDDLRRALDPPRIDPARQRDPGCSFEVEPAGLAAARSLPVRRLGEALRGLGCRRLEGVLRIEQDTFSLSLTSRLADSPLGRRRIAPEWLGWVPADRAIGAIAMAIDPEPEALAAAFDAADGVIHADPAKGRVAPLRGRLAVLALAAGVRLETEFWPALLGVSAAALKNPDDRDPPGLVVALHTDGDANARRIAERVLPRLATFGRLKEFQPDPQRPFEPVRRILGRPLAVARRGSTVWVGWGEGVLEACLGDPRAGRSALDLFRPSWGPRPPQRAGLLWPGRWPALDSSGMVDAPPVLWWGSRDGDTARDEIRWAGLHPFVVRVVDRVVTGE
ncbi:MAG TPA: hypothetical protein VG406_09225 [Isosphaeraceae bacterium]|jgi:hypothetical protein|nr:hypothetical protein [Isosphaeraceae bacterium]